MGRGGAPRRAPVTHDLMRYREQIVGPDGRSPELSKLIDMRGQRCRRCGKGTYELLHGNNEYNGTLDCTKCGDEVLAWQQPAVVAHNPVPGMKAPSSRQRPAPKSPRSSGELARDATLRADGFRPFVKKTLVWAKQMPKAFNVASGHGELRAKAGDYLLTDGVGRRWPVDQKIFAATYRWSKGPETDQPALRAEGFVPARKVTPVYAKPITKPTTIQTLEGPAKAAPGDWLAVGAKDERWPIKGEFFDDNYEPAPNEPEQRS